MLSDKEPKPSSDVIRRIFQIDRLAAMPHVIWEIMNALNREDTTPARVRQIIEQDLALSTKVLSLANSAHYGLPQKITTIERAVVIIGFQELSFLAMSAGLADFFDIRKVPARFDGEGLWVHSLAVSWVAKELATSARHPDPGGIMIAGLLHDLGKLVLATHLPDLMEKILDLVESRLLTYYQAEQEAGLPHSLVGYWLARSWGLPDMISQVIRDHHAVSGGESCPEAASMVALADALIRSLQIGLVDEAPPLDDIRVIETAGLNLDDYKQVAMAAETKISPMVDVWRAMLG
ncbi:MAG: HDOD domain-containing protein [Proteobacteria bacterium]|nr:HDOD domain-containing protein [Pseudomonadota bacterium]